MFKVATFNANSIRARLPIVQEWLKDHAPDLLCLQETKVQDPDFPVEAFQEVGYTVAFRGQKGYNGVAMASRDALEDVVFGMDDDLPSDEARVMRARRGDLWIVNTYVPQGTDPSSPHFAYKLQWFDRLLSYFDRHLRPDRPGLWVGDLNVAPDPIDVYDPLTLDGQVCFHPDERSAFKRMLDWGFVDVFRKHCPEAKQYSFWDYRVRGALARDIGWRLDHVLATRDLASRSVRAFIDKGPRLKERPSDHTFVCAEFEVR